MVGAAGSATGTAAGAAGLPPVVIAGAGAAGQDAEARGSGRRRRQGRALSTALPATFIGLLIVQALRPADAAAAEAGASRHPGAADPDDDPGGTFARPGGEQAPPVLLGADHGSGAGAAAAGSVLLTGSLIDPAALTRLSGTTRFADSPLRPLEDGGGPAAGALPGEVAGVTVAPAVVTLAVGAPAEAPELPTVPADGGEAPSDEDDPGEVGETDLDGEGDGVLRGTAGNDLLDGGAGDDIIQGQDGDDRVLGADGADRLEGGRGEDVLLGGTGNDRLLGGDENDRLDGEAGDDVVLGGRGHDVLAGGEGDDLLDGGSGTDLLRGGFGNDAYVIHDRDDGAVETDLGLAGGVDTLVVAEDYAANLARDRPLEAPDGLSTFLMGRRDPSDFPADVNGYHASVGPGIENVRLTGDADHDVVADGAANVLEGNAGDNRLYADAGDDELRGGAGDDWLAGGEGDDLLDGGEGDDMLYGGASDDTFLLGLAEGPARVFDREGSNVLRLKDPGADGSRLGAELEGRDLVVTYDGERLATIDGWAGNGGSFAGIDAGEGAGVRPLDGLLQGGGVAGGAEAKAALRDWLADFMDDGAGGGVVARGSGPPGLAEDAGGGLAAAGAPPSVPAWIPGPLDHGFAADPGAGEEEARHQRGDA